MVWSLIQKDSTCREATKPKCYNCWACTLKPRHLNYRAYTSKLLRPTGPTLCPPWKKSPCPEKPVHCNKSSPYSLQLEKSPHSNENPAQPKINKWIKFKRERERKKENAMLFWIKNHLYKYNNVLGFTVIYAKRVNKMLLLSLFRH